MRAELGPGNPGTQRDSFLGQGISWLGLKTLQLSMSCQRRSLSPQVSGLALGGDT